MALLLFTYTATAQQIEAEASVKTLGDLVQVSVCNP